MRYWILVALLNGLFALIMHVAAPDRVGSTAYYAGGAMCTLIAVVVTWRDPPGRLADVLFFLFKWGVVAASLTFFVWGIGYKLELWGEHNPDELFISYFDTMMPNLAMLTGIVILFGVFLRFRNR